MSNTVAVRIQNLTKKIGHKTIVDHLTFDIHTGEVFGFLGPNGAGKTTTIRMIVGLIGMSEGQVLVHGLDVSKEFRAAMKHVGAIVENPEMYKFLTGHQNLRHFARMTPGVTAARIDEVVELVGMEHRIHDKVKTYSLGMRQRLGLAQALLHKPSILILDEPTNGLDPAGIREFRDHLRKLAQEEGLAVIVSSHLLSEMELMCDRAAIIQNGKLIRVENMRDMVMNNEAQKTRIEVDQLAKAREVLRRRLPEVEVQVEDDELELAIERNQIPDVVADLVEEGVRIFAVRAVTKTLEESFLEMTGDGVIV